MSMNIQNQAGDEKIIALMETQEGIAYGVEGTCLAGRYVYSVVHYFVPFDTEPVYVDLSNVSYTNCQNLEVYDTNRFGFIVRAEVIADGGAIFEFAWHADLIT